MEVTHLHHFILLILLVSQLLGADAISWLSIGISGPSTMVFNDRRGSRVCRRLPGLTKKQTRLCRKYFEHMDSVRSGAQNSYLECQYQFRTRRWNCTAVDPVNLFGDVVVKDGTREAAFVHAIASAGVAHRVTQDCSSGLLEQCGCDQSVHSNRPGDDFKWAGCSDNVHYGIAFARTFVDAGERGKNQTRARMQMNLHNNRAGRIVLTDHMRTECKCHGLSGSCEMKTCWKSMPSFRRIGDIIKDKFDGATEVHLARRDSEPRARMERKNPHVKRHTHNDLVYLVDSPDYCTADPRRGVLGTAGRECNVSSMGTDGCDLLCCHRGHTTKIERKRDMCHCKFHYCCRVECQPCEVEKRIDVCL